MLQKSIRVSLCSCHVMGLSSLRLERLVESESSLVKLASFRSCRTNESYNESVEGYLLQQSIDWPARSAELLDHQICVS